MATTVRHQFKRGTAADWSTANPVLLDGEPGFDKTNRMLKVGDGVTAWNDLPYFSPPEVNFVKELSATDVANGYIELPENCDTEQAITVMWEGVLQIQGEDWEVNEKDPPELDQIAWKGFGMEEVARAGDKVSVTYYKKS